MKILMQTYDKTPKENRLLIKYEDLLKNTKSILTDLYQFLNITITAEQIDKIITKYDFENIPYEKKGKGQRNRIASPGAWQRNFSNTEIKTMEEIMNETLEKIGYAI
jgi:hypothetical protein